MLQRPPPESKPRQYGRALPVRITGRYKRHTHMVPTLSMHLRNAQRLILSRLQPLTAAHWKHAVKTGIAGSLAMLLANLLHLPEAYWAAVSAVIVMQSEYDATLKAGFTRLAGTAIGALVVIPFAEVLPGNIAAFGAAVIITLLACAALKLEESQRLAAATVVLIMLIGHPDPPWLSAVHRFLEVSFGIVVSLLVTRYIWPAAPQR